MGRAGCMHAWMEHSRAGGRGGTGAQRGVGGGGERKRRPRPAEEGTGVGTCWCSALVFQLAEGWLVPCAMALSDIPSQAEPGASLFLSQAPTLHPRPAHTLCA